MISIRIEADEEKGVDSYIKLFEEMKEAREQVEKSDTHG